MEISTVEDNSEENTQFFLHLNYIEYYYISIVPIIDINTYTHTHIHTHTHTYTHTHTHIYIYIYIYIMSHQVNEHLNIIFNILIIIIYIMNIVIVNNVIA